MFQSNSLTRTRTHAHTHTYTHTHIHTTASPHDSTFNLDVIIYIHTYIYTQQLTPHGSTFNSDVIIDIPISGDLSDVNCTTDLVMFKKDTNESPEWTNFSGTFLCDNWPKSVRFTTKSFSVYAIGPKPKSLSERLMDAATSTAGVIAGAVIGTLVGVLIIVGVVCCVRRSKKKGAVQDEAQNDAVLSVSQEQQSGGVQSVAVGVPVPPDA